MIGIASWRADARHVPEQHHLSCHLGNLWLLRIIFAVGVSQNLGRSSMSCICEGPRRPAS